MARTRDKLSARQVGSLASGRKHSDGGGLYLRVDNNSRRWVYAFTLAGREREMGLGAYPAVSLSAARKLRNDAEALVKDGRDPIAARDAALKAETGKPTFGEAAGALIAAKSSQWRNAKHAAQWSSTLETYCAAIWDKPVDEIDTEGVLAILQPIWTTKPETASRLRGRMEAVLDAARARGHIAASTANPARWRGHLDKLLAQRAKLSRGHHVALPYAQVPAFLARLRERPAVAAMALEFTIMTAARTGEVLGATWDEVDLEAKVWTIPAARMKAAREHRIPLAARPLAILQDLAQAKVGAFVFPGQRSDRPLSSAAMEMLLRRMGGAHAKNTKSLKAGTDKTDETPPDAARGQKKIRKRSDAEPTKPTKPSGITVHGFRSSFRDWAGNETHFPRELAEAALAHVIGDKAEQAYRRSDALEKRRALMEAWAAWCEGAPAGNVVAIRKA